MKEQQELMKELLENAKIPALSLSWYQKGTRHAVAYGETDTSAPSPVDTDTLFQAASLSKPVSAAIVLDLVNQGQWTLDTCLADIAEYGPPELRQDPYYDNYRKLTIAMVIGQCSGLANYGEDGQDGKKFIAEPNTRFTYSGVALEFLKEIIEKKTGKKWEEIAQDFFKKARMNSSTFMRQLPDSQLNNIHRDVASAHESDPNPDRPFVSLPPLPDDVPGIAAGSMLTTAEDYITFLQYCFNDEFIRKNLLTGTLSTLPPTNSPATQVQWGLGMGVYNDSSDPENQRTIAFHWGNNTGSIAFCAMDMATGDCVVSFSNSMNGVSVFQHVAEPIVGDVKPLFQWLADYCGFKDKPSPKALENITTIVHSLHSLAETSPVDNEVEITAYFKQSMKQLQNSAESYNPEDSDNKSSMTP